MMRMPVHWCISIAVIFFYVSTSKAVCDHIFTRDDDIYILSDQPTTYEEAEETCQSYGGNLAQISSQNERQFFETHLRKYYISDEFVKVNILSRETNFNGRPYDLYKYRPEDGLDINDDTSISGFTTPEENELKSIMLYKRSLTNFNEAVQFCWYDSRDSVKVPCDDGWNDNFKLYGGTSQTSKTIQVYNYLVKDGPPKTSKLSLTEIEDQFYPISQFLPHFYLPDISVFTGARSDVGQSNFWNNGTRINDPTYPISDTSVCQQMTWPLTYDDGINLRAKECGLGESHYICRVRASLDEVECDGNSLRLSIPALIANNATVKVIVEGETMTFPPPQMGIRLISDLKQRTQYMFKVGVQFTGCPKIQTEVTGTTGYGTPDPVTSAYVKTATANKCEIAWTHEGPDNETIEYKITFIGKSGKAISVDANTIGESSNELKEEQLVDIFKLLSDHGYNDSVPFKIQAVSSCGNTSEIAEVSGTCISLMDVQNESLSTNDVVIAIVVPLIVVVVILIILLLFYKLKYKKRNSSKIAHNASIETSTATTFQNLDQENESDQRKVLENKPQHPQKNQTELPIIQEKSEDTCSTVNKVLPSAVIRTEDFAATYLDELATDFSNWKSQFKEIVKTSLENQPPHELSNQHKPKNRYKNIYPYDHAAVPLENCGGYINAAFIEGFENPKRFIAAQGPKPNTITDFWEMIWTQNSSVIVMLCNCIEAGKVKCEAYWPSLGLPLVCERLLISTLHENNIADILIRKLKIQQTNTNEERTVIQFHYTGWPDHGAPVTTTSINKLKHLVTSEFDNAASKGPIVVNCSAGVGRTGTFIAFDNLVQEANNSNQVDVMQAVMKMRMNRKDMVQTATQYTFLHKIVFESQVLPQTEMSVAEFLSNMEDSEWSKMQALKELELLSHPIVNNVTDHKHDSSSTKTYENVGTSNDPSKEIRVFADPNFIPMDAYCIQSCYYPGPLIASPGPKEGDEENFWNMVLQQQARFVIALDTMESNPFVSNPVEIGTILNYGAVALTVGHNESDASQLRHKFNISTQSCETPLEVTHVFINFPDNFNPSSFQKLLNDIKISMRMNNRSQCLVCCRDGNNKTGLFLTVANLIEQIKCEEKIDVFRNVKDLRDYRRTLLNEKELYKLCFGLIRQYLQSSSEENEAVYQNV